MTDDDPVGLLSAKLADLVAQREALDEAIARHRLALAALTEDELPRVARLRKPSTAGVALVAALATFAEPVSSSTLMDHPDLTHYSRHTLRTALGELRQAGRIEGTRGPKGFIWQPPRNGA